MDESDLTRFAGTPTFLAPEIISDGSADMSASGSTTSNLQTTESTATEVRRSPISKAIDIWAFGVTLYAFLFGKLPFVAESEYQIYNKIKEEDWDVPETMGQDEIPVGGRHQKRPKKGLETDGYLVIDLLQGLLEKDPSKRLTLQDVKVRFDALSAALHAEHAPAPPMDYSRHAQRGPMAARYQRRRGCVISAHRGRDQLGPVNCTLSVQVS